MKLFWGFLTNFSSDSGSLFKIISFQLRALKFRLLWILSSIFRELTSEWFPRGAEEDASEELEHFCGRNVVDDECVAGRLRREAVVLEEERQLGQPAGIHEAENTQISFIISSLKSF